MAELEVGERVCVDGVVSAEREEGVAVGAEGERGDGVLAALWEPERGRLG